MKINNDKLNKAKNLGILNRLEDEDITQNKNEISIDLIDFNEKNFYNQGDLIEDIIDLSESIEEVGLMHNIVVKPSGNGRFVLISGEKRTRAFKFLFDKTNDSKWKLIPCKIKDDLGNNVDEEIALIKANRDVRERSESVKAKEVERLEALYEGKKAAGEKVGTIRKRIAKDLGMSETQVQRYKSINSLIPEFKELLDSGEVNLSAVEYFTSFEPDVQKAIFHSVTKLDQKLNRDDAKAIRDEVKSTIAEGQEEIKNKESITPQDPQLMSKIDKKNEKSKKIVEEVSVEVAASQHVIKAFNAVKAMDVKLSELAESGINIGAMDCSRIKEMIKMLENWPFTL